MPKSKRPGSRQKVSLSDAEICNLFDHYSYERYITFDKEKQQLFTILFNLDALGKSKPNFDGVTEKVEALSQSQRHYLLRANKKSCIVLRPAILDSLEEEQPLKEEEQPLSMLARFFDCLYALVRFFETKPVNDKAQNLSVDSGDQAQVDASNSSEYHISISLSR